MVDRVVNTLYVPSHASCIMHHVLVVGHLGDLSDLSKLLVRVVLASCDICKNILPTLPQLVLLGIQLDVIESWTDITDV